MYCITPARDYSQKICARSDTEPELQQCCLGSMWVLKKFGDFCLHGHVLGQSMYGPPPYISSGLCQRRTAQGTKGLIATSLRVWSLISFKRAKPRVWCIPRVLANIRMHCECTPKRNRTCEDSEDIPKDPYHQGPKGFRLRV